MDFGKIRNMCIIIQKLMNESCQQFLQHTETLPLSEILKLPKPYDIPWTKVCELLKSEYNMDWDIDTCKVIWAKIAYNQNLTKGDTLEENHFDRTEHYLLNEPMNDAQQLDVSGTRDIGTCPIRSSVVFPVSTIKMNDVEELNAMAVKMKSTAHHMVKKVATPKKRNVIHLASAESTPNRKEVKLNSTMKTPKPVMKPVQLYGLQCQRKYPEMNCTQVIEYVRRTWPTLPKPIYDEMVELHKKDQKRYDREVEKMTRSNKKAKPVQIPK